MTARILRIEPMTICSDASLDCFSKLSLRNEMQRIRNFYLKYSINPTGGFFQSINAEGQVNDDGLYHLVSSCRMTTNFARTAVVLGETSDLEVVTHGLAFIESVHKRDDEKGYHWLVKQGQVQDSDQYCYGYAFLMLTYANAYKAGIDSAKDHLEAVHKLMQDYFWQAEFGLYADQFSIDTQTLLPYRGQNANMHACEALMSAYEATSEPHYLERAMEIANNIVRRQTQTTDGYIWEHYQSDWSLDFDYNREDPKNLYKPWGYQPGHFTEWAKLLLMLDHFAPQDWLRERAAFLIEKAVELSWDHERGGMFYGFAPDESICDDEKYFWVHAETLAALALAVAKLGDEFKSDLNRLTDYVNRAYIQPTGVWWRVLSANNLPTDEWVALPGAKCDYHTLGSYIDMLGFSFFEE